MKEHALYLVFCVFDYNTLIRILPYVFMCVGFIFSTMDDDPPYVFDRVSGSVNWLYDIYFWWKKTCEEEAILLINLEGRT
jgi:hypothetical protein